MAVGSRVEGWLWINCNERACKSVTRKSHCLFQKRGRDINFMCFTKQVQLSNERIRLCIVDDHSFIRESLHTILDVQENLQVVGMAKDGEQALELCERLKPDVVLMDLEMPNLDGIHATKMIKKKWPRHSCTHSVNLSEYRKGKRNHTKWCGWIFIEIHRGA